MRLLVIEDEPRIAEILKSGLQQTGFAVDIVHCCADARATLALTAYDAAILDLGLPDGDGLDLLAEWRAARNGVPVLVLTGTSTAARSAEALSAAAFVEKPFEPDQLVEAVLKALSSKAPFAAIERRVRS